MDIKELFLTRQSTREYKNLPVSDETLEEICRLACLAPSAINAQPWKLYAISGSKAEQFRKLIQVNGANSWADSVRSFIVIEQRSPYAVMRGERRVSNEEFIPNDIGILTAYLTLAAESLGVQSCIVGLRDEKGIAEFLELPEDSKFPLVVTLGYAVDGYPVREKRRRDFDKVFTLIK